jgi:hypothetical protein
MRPRLEWALDLSALKAMQQPFKQLHPAVL